MKSVQPTSLSVNGPQRSRVLVSGHDTRDTAMHQRSGSKAKAKQSCCCCLSDGSVLPVCPHHEELKTNGTVSLLLLYSRRYGFLGSS